MDHGREDDGREDDGRKADVSPQRRRFFRTVTLVPAAAVVVGLPGCGDSKAPGVAPSPHRASAYRPTFFSAAEWTFLVAAMDHLIPSDELGPGAVEAGVPEFLDRHMNTPYAAGDIWYLQGPFVEAPTQFGYQGRLPLRDLLRVGIRSFDDYCRGQFGGKTFAALDRAQQEQLLKGADTGKLKFADLSAKTFFDYLLNEVRAGYFSDPSHGGNRDMAGWKAIGYPGVRADFIDWVGVRDKPYPLPPVDMAGRRG